jgi:hypothetical protein
MPNSYQYLEPRLRSSLRQPFVKGRNIWAEVLYRETTGEDARTPEQVAEDFDVPVGAVLESIDFCVANEAFLRQERAREEMRSREYYHQHPPLAPTNSARA